MAESRWNCPHCGSSLDEVVYSLIKQPKYDGATSYHTCGGCDGYYSVALSLDVHVGNRSFRQDHPDLAAKIAEKEGSAHA